ncbi:MAG: hypothetical protein HYX76_03465 [Acidobacteria bacterium]|nr:hypothetical protein [Acidobacteriota bacterium]
MASINTRGVILGGVVAGFVINISEYVLNEPVLGGQMAEALTAHNLPPIGGSAIALFLILGFALGLVLVWLYAAIRPRFGPGPKTAAIAGVVVWFLAYFTSSLNFGAIGLLPARLLLIGLVWGLVELIVASLVGGWLYSEA